MKLRGAAAVITGGASGIGAATARMLVAQGCRVALIDLDREPGAALARELGADNAVFFPGDISEPDDMEQAFEAIAAELGEVHIHVGCAAIGPSEPTLDVSGRACTMEVFRKVLDVNLIGTYDVVRRAAELMARNAPSEDGERGVVVLLSSAAAYDGQAGQCAYVASKAAVSAMAAPLARDLGPHGIRVVAIAPGPVDTPRLARHPEAMRESFAEAMIFPKRLARAAEIAQFTRSVIENTVVNATTLRVDAGYRSVQGRRS